ncbi:MAG: polysaccharide deacetylase family protein [Saprospiraceae bacterium]|nr:polysaccharide deacetylase family protein [Saprospiraceae bacterium]
MLHIAANDRSQPEKQYCFHVLFHELLGLEYRVVFSEEKNYRLRLPNGREIVVEDHFFSSQKEGACLRPENVPTDAPTFPSPFDGSLLTPIFGTNHFVFNEKEARCGLDVFASAFFMLTRWEEFVSKERDQHGRFPAAASLAFKAGFLDRPVVNEYAELLWQMFARLGWQPPRPNREFKLTVTCDVDHPRLWWSAGDRLKTLAGSIFKRGDFGEAAFWLKNYFFQKRDPYDVFDEWLALFEKNDLTGHFNFLGKRPPTSDCWYSLEHPFVKNLLQKIAARGHVVGFHPSVEASENQEIFQKELASLRALSPTPVTTGRQHYLRFFAPETWQVWEDAGMAWDSTLGYPEAEGFRCGICQEFPVFNFLTHEMLNLKEKPLIAMDVTLALYRKYTPETAFEKLQNLRREVERHGGEFVLLWHNSSWNTYFWAEWREVFRNFISQ